MCGLGLVHGVQIAALAFVTPGVLILGILNFSSRIYFETLEFVTTYKSGAKMLSKPRESTTFYLPLHDATPIFVGLKY